MNATVVLEDYQARVGQFRKLYGSEAACLASPYLLFTNVITPHGRGKPIEESVVPPSVLGDIPKANLPPDTSLPEREGYPFVSICLGNTYVSVWNDLEISTCDTGAGGSRLRHRGFALDGRLTVSLQVLFYDYARAVIGANHNYRKDDVFNLMVDMVRRTREAIGC